MESLLAKLLLFVTSILLTVVGWMLKQLWAEVAKMKDVQATHGTSIALLQQAQKLHLHRRTSDEIP